MLTVALEYLVVLMIAVDDTVTEIFAKHLIQIPGFSADKAEAVIAQFPTPTRSANNLVVQWNLLIRTLENVDTCIIHTPSCGPK